MSPKEILENAIRGDSNVEFLIALEGDRLVIRIPVDSIEQHPTLSAIRGEAPDIALLTASMASSGNTSVYTPCLYAELSAGEVVYYVADGHQRVQAAKDNGITHLVCQVITRWLNDTDAFRECVNIQAARFEMTDSDVFSILKTSVMSVAEVAKHTGRKESTLQKMKNVCIHKVLTDLIKAEVMSTNVASNLIIKCNKSQPKINALLNSLQDIYAEKLTEANHWRDKLGPNPKDKKLKEKTQVASYFKNFDWKKYEDAVDKDGNTKFVNARIVLDLTADEIPSTESLVVGDTASAWEKEIPIVMTTPEHDKLPLEHLESFLLSLPLIQKNFETIIARRKAAIVKSDLPLFSGNPVVTIDAPAAPKKQVPDMTTN
jgi:hypothetical protein